jgi:hypothetical protein
MPEKYSFRMGGITYVGELDSNRRTSMVTIVAPLSSYIGRSELLQLQINGETYYTLTFLGDALYTIRKRLLTRA